jgi:hypothetical protein
MYARAMVNADVVNAHASCSNRADFCIIFAVSGRFMLFKKPVKYVRIFEINQGRACRERPAGAHLQNIPAISVR